MRVVVAAVILAGCGRVAFDPSAGTRDDSGGAVADALGTGIDAPVGSLTVTFGEFPNATFKNVTRDTSISNAGPATDNYGTTDHMIVQAASAAVSLVRFDLTGIPTTATVLKATLRLHMISGDTCTATAFAMNEAWDEGTFDGETGVASWSFRQTGLAWSGVGASPPSRGAAAIGTGSFVAPSQSTNIELAPAVVQAWVQNDAANFGVALLGTSVNTNVATRESTSVDARPQMVVVYTP